MKNTYTTAAARIDTLEIEAQSTIMGMITNLRGWQYAAHECLNNGGITINRHGERYLLKDGYSVGMTTGTAVILPASARYMDLIKAWQKILESFPTASHVGGWIDQDTGSIHLDPCVIVADRESAISLARENRQLAIFSFATMEEIRLGFVSLQS